MRLAIVFFRRIALVPALLSFLLVQPRSAQALTSNLPLIYLNTDGNAIEGENAVEATVAISSDAQNESKDILRKQPEYSAKIKIRGYSSAAWSKHQYALKLHDTKDSKMDVDVPLLGLPAHHDWVLAAPYSDRSLIRNAFAFEMARDLSEPGNLFWAPHTRAFELFLNGEYQGVYYLTEKVDHSKNRLNLGKTDLRNAKASPFLVKVERSKNMKPDEYFTTPQHSRVVYVEPKAKKIAKLLKEDPKNARALVGHIQGTMNSFEESVLAIEEGNFSSYRKKIDSRSFQNFILVQEVLKNLDGFRRSMNLYLKEGILHMGPVWDFDLTLGNIHAYSEMNPEGFQSGHNWYIDGNSEVFWFRTLLKDPSFKRELIERYRDLRKSGKALSTASLIGHIDRLTGELGPAAERNFTVWNPNMLLRDGPLYLFIPKYSDFCYADAVADLKNFLLQRLDWLDRNIQNIGNN